MDDDARALEDVEAEFRRLRKEIRTSRRETAQWKRTAETSEAMSIQSKKVLLRATEDLERTILELEDAKRRAELASDAKSRFLAVMSHEIRTPMNGVLGTLELLLSTEMTEEAKELARVSHDSSTALLQIINDALDLSKIEAGAMILERIPFDVRENLLEVIRTVSTPARRKGLQLQSRVDSDVPLRVDGDPTRLRQILLNLVGNAIKFSDGGEIVVRVRAGRNPGRAFFAVTDQGIGIRPEALARIFEQFGQEDDSTTRRFGGTGLGLAICRNLVSLMGGELGVESAVGEGSEFHFEIDLPAAQAEESTATDDSDAESKSEPSRIAPGLGYCKALVVDDNPVNRMIAKKMLERLGLEIELATDGLEAVAAVVAREFDVVFMDCSMPNLDGYDATRRIRSYDGPRSRVPIVAMTAFALRGDRERCEACGMNEYVPKPVRQEDLIGVLTRLADARSASAGV